MSQNYPNPYAAPAPVNTMGGPGPYYGPPPQSPWVTQILVVCILMFVQAGFEILMGLFLLIYAAFFGVMGTVAMNDPNRATSPAGGPPPDVLFGIFAAGLGLVCLLCIVSGSLRIYAGLNNLKHRKRGLGIISLCVGAATSITFYCLPTSIGLLIYGLIVYLQPDTRRAFDANGG